MFGISAYRLAAAVAGGALTLAAGGATALSVVQSTDGDALLNALVPNQGLFDSIAVTVLSGDPSQVGTYSGFNLPPVTFGGGIVLSTGPVSAVVGPAQASDNPSFDLGGGSTAEINAYAPGKVFNWSNSNDAVVVQVKFKLADTAAIAFSFVFGSIEYPNWVDQYTDAAFGFLDGQQIIFDSLGNAVQVGSSFASQLTTADTNTAFADPHGLLRPLVTTSGLLAPDIEHTLLLEIADTNDHILDSGIFIGNFRTSAAPGNPDDGGPQTEPEDVPEPGSLAMLAFGLGMLALRRRR